MLIRVLNCFYNSSCQRAGHRSFMSRLNAWYQVLHSFNRWQAPNEVFFSKRGTSPITLVGTLYMLVMLTTPDSSPLADPRILFHSTKPIQHIKYRLSASLETQISIFAYKIAVLECSATTRWSNAVFIHHPHQAQGLTFVDTIYTLEVQGFQPTLLLRHTGNPFSMVF